MADIPPRQQVSGSDTIRMGQTKGLPQYRDPNAAQRSATQRAEVRTEALARRTPENNDQAFAILKAFQDYLEHERQRAQRRTAIAITVFSVLLVTVIISFIAVWLSTMGSMQGTQTDLLRMALAAREEREAAHTQADISATVNAAVAQAVAQAEREANEKAAREKALREAEDARRAAEAEALEKRLAEERRKNAEEAAAKEAALAQALKSLNETVEALRKDNDMLRGRISRPSTAAPAQRQPQPAQATQATGAPKPAAAKSAAQNNAPSAASETPAPSAQPAAPKKNVAQVGTIVPPLTIKRPVPPKGYAAESITIPVGQDGASQVNWRLLLPNELPAQ